MDIEYRYDVYYSTTLGYVHSTLVYIEPDKNTYLRLNLGFEDSKTESIYYIQSGNKNTYYTHQVPDMRDCTEEELFQYSLVKEYDCEVVQKVQRIVFDNIQDDDWREEFGRRGTFNDL